MSAPEPGQATVLESGLRRVLAPNPGPMTHWGTNSYILGEGEVIVVDPGPDDPSHLDALLRATSGERIAHILVTHAHADHSPLARRLAEASGAPVYGFGPAHAGRSPTMKRLAETGLAGGGEGADPAFMPDIEIGEGDRVAGVEVLHTPGHFAGHLAFRWKDTVLSGDHVMDWASSLVSPPDGDISDFMATSARLHDLGARRLMPGHGAPIENPSKRLDWLIAHRRARETSILEALSDTAETVDALTARIYADTPAAMLPAAARNVFAHLIDLVERGLAQADPELSPKARFRRL